MDQEKIKAEKIKQEYEGQWLRLKGVTAVGIGLVDQKVGIIVSVESNKYKEQAIIPNQINGVPIIVEVSGHLTI